MLSRILLPALLTLSCSSDETKKTTKNQKKQTLVEFQVLQDSKVLEIKPEGIYKIDVQKPTNIVWKGLNKRNLFCNVGVINVSDWEYALPLVGGKFDVVSLDFKNDKSGEITIPPQFFKVDNKYSINLFCLKSESKEKIVLLRKDTGLKEEGVTLNSTSIIALKNAYKFETLGKPLRIQP